MKKNIKLNKWDLILKPKNSIFETNFKEIYNYRDLIFLIVKRDFVTFYKQTILGPLWYIIQPLVNTIVFTIIFGKLAKISTDGSTPFLFYMAGNVAWGYFAICLSSTSNIFVTNKDLFGKVYFPRLVVPIANVIISLMQFLIQFILFICFLVYFYFNGLELNIGLNIFLVPLLVLQTAFLGLGTGILISSLTSKYRDLTFAMGFAVQLWMYATPIVFPLSIVPDKYRIIAAINPMTSIVEVFKKIFLGTSAIEISHIFISILSTLIILIFGLLMFSKIEKNFMDTV